MRSAWKDSPAARKRLRGLYFDRDVTVTALCAALPIGRDRLYRIAKEEAWQPRRHLRTASVPAAPAKRTRPAVGNVPDVSSMKGLDRHGLALRLEHFIAKRIAALEADIADKRDHDPERLARALTQMVRGLTILRAYRADLDKERVSDDADAPPRSLSELRDELRRHLVRIRDEERTREDDRSAGPA